MNYYNMFLPEERLFRHIRVRNILKITGLFKKVDEDFEELLKISASYSIILCICSTLTLPLIYF